MKLKLFSIALLTICSLTTYGQKTEIRDIKDFSGIYVIGNIRCEIFPAEKEKIEIIAIGSELSNVIAEKDGDILNLRLKTNTPADAKIKIKLSYKNLNTLITQAQALIINKDTLKAESIQFEVRGGGKMELLLDIETLLKAEVKQGGILVFRGKTDVQEISVSSGGTYSAYELEAKDSYVKALSGGKAKVKASRIIDANATAKGYIGYQGKPESVVVKTSLGGQIEQIQEED